MHTFHTFRLLLRLAGVAFASCASACVYDADSRCGAGQVFEGACVCAPGKVYQEGGCIAMEAIAGGSPLPEGGMGEPVVSGQGEPCSSQEDCADYDASYCTVGSPVAEICALPDCSEGDCPAGYTCTDLTAFMPGLPTLCLEAF